MSQGLFVEDDKDVDEAESDGDYEGAPAAAVRAVDRKTKQQRRKEKEREEEVSVMSWMNRSHYWYFFPFGDYMPWLHPTPPFSSHYLGLRWPCILN